MKFSVTNFEEHTAYKFIIIFLSSVAATLIAIETTELESSLRTKLLLAETLFFGALTLDYFVHIFKNFKKKKLYQYLVSFEGLVDFVAFVPFLILINDFSSINYLKYVLGIATFLKIARFSHALKVFKEVLINERKSLLGSLYIMLLLTFFLSTILYFIERNVNPKGFSSIVESMWWSIITLSTVGYGDIVPLTALGKFIGAIASIVGLGMFALPAGILANGFAQELARVKFITNWRLVAKVPIFASLEKGTITDIAKLLHLNRFSAGELIIKHGDMGDSMYFILEGEVDVILPGSPDKIVLHPGDFFGEIALLKDTKRGASIIAKQRCRVLELTAYDFKKLVKSKPEILKAIEEVAHTRIEFS